MSDTYTEHAAICAKFYELTLQSQSVAEFLFEKIQAASGDRALFVGGMFEIARALVERDLLLTAVDYTEEMVEIGTRRLPDSSVIKADLRSLPFNSEFDLAFVIGRVFTHMLDSFDLRAAIQSCKRSLRSGGKLLIDNYESSRIQSTNYFNGEVRCYDDDTYIVRRSTTERLLADPYIVRWNAEYSGQFQGKSFRFTDSIDHRAFTRSEFASALEQEGLEIIEQGDNFDETSFYTAAIKVP